MFGESGRKPGKEDQETKKMKKIATEDLELAKKNLTGDEVESQEDKKISEKEIAEEKCELLKVGDRKKLTIVINDKEKGKTIYDNLPYDIKRKIGAGGQGNIFEAERPAVDIGFPEVPREIAIKTIKIREYKNVRRGGEDSLFLSNAGTMNEFAIARILSEGSGKSNRVTGEIIEPMPEGMVPKYYGVTKLYQRDPSNNRKIDGYVFAMEKLDGIDLKKVLAQRQENFINNEIPNEIEREIFLRGSLEEIIDIVGIVSEIHKRKIVFNDLKPQNIMMRSDGRVCLVDFGSAQFFNPSYSVVTERKKAFEKSTDRIERKKRDIESKIMSDQDVMELSVEARAELIRELQRKEMGEILEKTPRISGLDDYIIRRKKFIITSLDYSSPEQWMFLNKLSLKSDVFSLGVVLLEYLYGKEIFNREDISDDMSWTEIKKQVTDKMESRYVDFDKVRKQTLVSSGDGKGKLPALEEETWLIELLQRCINPDPNKRPASNELFSELEEIKMTLNEGIKWSLKELADTDVHEKMKK